MRVLIAIVLALTLAGGQAMAQQSATPETLAEKQALVRRYFKAIEFEKLMDSLVASMVPGMLADASRSNATLSAEEQELLSDAVRTAMNDVMTPKLIELNVSIYAEAFSERELQALVSFYESPEGRSIMRKTPGLMPKSMEGARRLMPQMQSEVLKRVCSKIDCNADRRPENNRS